MSTLNGLILTGGHSKRMGQDKALIEINGQSLLDRTAGLLGLSMEEVYVSVRLDQVNEKHRAKYPLIIDQKNSSGPLAGILSAGDFAPHNAWLVIACDMPFIDSQSIEQLIKFRNPERVATVFSSPDGSGIEPLCAIYEPLFFHQISSDPGLIKNSSPRETLSRMETEIIQSMNPEALFNANSSVDELTSEFR